MSDESAGNTNADIIVELQKLRSEIAELKQLYGSAQEPSTETPLVRPYLRVHFSRLQRDRKPFAVQVEGSLSTQLHLSPIRTAILLTLLYDLQQRSDGGRGVNNPTETIARINALFKGEEEPESIPESVRVAIYRFNLFSKDSELFTGEDFSLGYNSEECRLDVVRSDGNTGAQGLELHITTSHETISSILDEVLEASPLQRARKDKALYIPGGADGIDRLVLEIFDCQYPVKQTSLFYRPSFQSFPEDLLYKVNASQRKIRRRAVLLQGYETGRCEYTEVINLSALWNLIRLNDNNSFQLYPPRVTAPDIIDHLEYMAAQPEKYEGYKMVITDALLPFCLSTYTIESSTLPEHYTLFLGQLGQKTVYDEGSFIIEGQKIYQGFVEKILQLVYCNPTTITDQAQVKDVLLNIAAQLREKGPLAPNDFAPSLINPD